VTTASSARRASGRAAQVALLVVASAALGHCRDVPSEPGRAPTPPRARATLAAGSLDEGSIEAFGLKMPAGTTVRRRTPGSVSFSVPAPFEKVTDFMRTKLLEAKVDHRAKKVTFTNARVAGVEPATRVYVSVKRASLTSDVLVRLEPGPQPEPTDVDPSAEEELEVR
jgi:hypothetical protein